MAASVLFRGGGWARSFLAVQSALASLCLCRPTRRRHQPIEVSGDLPPRMVKPLCVFNRSGKTETYFKLKRLCPEMGALPE